MNKAELDITQLQDQITDLKAEIVELSAGLSSTLGDAKRAAGPAMASLRGTIDDAAHSMKGQGQAALGTIRDNPGTMSSVAATAGLIGLAVGYLLGSATTTSSNSRWRF